MSAFHYPTTRRGSDATEYFGQTIADPWRWLEGDAHADPAVQAWIEAQNAVTGAHLEALPGRDIFRRRMAALLRHQRHSVPVQRGDRLFFERHDGVANQSVLYLQDAGAERVLIDPNLWSDDKADALAEWAVSDDGRHLAYAVQVGGTDWRQIRVMEVATGRVLEDRIDWARFTKLAWTPDGEGFFYSRFPTPAGGATAGAAVTGQAVYFHRLGTAQSDDRLVHATPEAPGLLHIAERRPGARWLSIASTPGTPEQMLTVLDLQATEGQPRPIIATADAEWAVIGEIGTRLVVVTTEGAPRRRVVTFDLAERDPQPVELVAEDAAILNDAVLTGDSLILGYLVDAKTELRRFTLDGRPESAIPLPGIGTAGGFSASPGSPDCYFIFTSYDVPATVLRYRTDSGDLSVWAAPEAGIPPGVIGVEQRFCSSKDGTRIPFFVIRRRDVTGPAPTLLYGYGGFGISLVPIYNEMQLAWVEQGGALVVANIRGGGEYGTDWHQAARLDRRQNAYDDFIAVAAHLKGSGIAAPKGLAIQGESNGGLLVGAVTNQRPDLFDVALPGVGVLDMLRFREFTAGAMWAGEFGLPDDEAIFRTLLSYSPLHTIRAGEEYPAVLVTTADTDDRVVPAHSFKYTAALQAADLGAKPRLIRIETRAGHGAGMPLDKMIALHADMWAFAAHWTGLVVKEDP